MTEPLRINRAPVLTLWATVVAERIGLSRTTALTVGQAVAGYAAQAKGTRLGIYHSTDAPAQAPEGAVRHMVVLGCEIALVTTPGGERAIAKGAPVDSQAVVRYLRGKFGASLTPAFEAMQALAAAYPPEQLNREGFRLYERFRPEVPKDEAGWGKAGVLDLDRIRALARP